MTDNKLNELATQMVSQLKSMDDFKAMHKLMLQQFINNSLEAEMSEHLGYDKHQKSEQPNKRNGKMSKTIGTELGDIQVDTPRDRESSFEPQLVKKNQTRITGIDEQILYFYAKGQSTSEISETIRDIYGVEVSDSVISRVTDAVMADVVAWQNRPLDPVYPIVYLDCIVVKIRQDNRIINKAIYLALGVNLQGKKELLGMWLSENLLEHSSRLALGRSSASLFPRSGAKFWLTVMTQLQNRGVKDILIACVDGLKGFTEVINTVYPDTQVQLCVVHMLRYSMKFVPYKDRKAIAYDLKLIYGADTEELALANLEQFDKTWSDKYPQIAKSWQANWSGLSVFFNYPKDIRKAIYTTNAIESLNSVLRSAVNKRKVFPSDESAKKVVYLAVLNASKKWTMPIRDWTSALNRFTIEFGDRVEPYL